MSNRSITVNGKVWKYRIGKGNLVAKDEEANKSYTINFADLTGWNWTEIEREQDDKRFHITPRQVADWIKTL